MGQATTLILRERILELRTQGETIKRIGEELSIPISTVKKLCRRFRELGPSGLQPSYSNCGSSTAGRLKGQRPEAVRQRALHPGWGAPRIHVELGRELAAEVGLASIRTMQRCYSPRRQGSGRPLAVPLRRTTSGKWTQRRTLPLLTAARRAT